jgi:hypothetical protein
MGLFSDVVADSRPRSLPARTTGSIAPLDQESSTMISVVEERSAGPRQGVDPSPPSNEAVAVSRTAEGIFRLPKGKRSTEEGTTNGHDKDFGRSEDELLGERNRQERTTDGLHVDLDAHFGVPSLSGQTAVSSGAPFKRETELSGNTDSKRTNHLSNVSNEELDNGTGVPEASQNPGKAPLPPEPEAVVPSAAKSAEALPPVKQATATEGRRERVFEDDRNESPAAKRSPLIVAPEPDLPSPPAPLPERERGETRRSASVPSVSARGEESARSGDGRVPAPNVATLPSPAPGEGPGVRAAGHERPLAAPISAPTVLAAPRREAPREPSGPRVQIGRLEVIVTAPAPAAPAAPPSAPSPKPGALASRRYLRSL